jgi:muramoyltetrapeptide carboxypeptidase LdcA involved in peptidoglycan recycling
MMLNLKKPRVLAPGSRVATVTPSWGGPGSVPARYDMGVRELRERFGFEVVEMPHVRADPDWVWRNPQARAADLNAAWADPGIDGIIATIGGEDSIRILPYLDTTIIAAHPKAFMGYSDITTIHTLALLNGVQTFYGPSVMAGIAENGGTLPYTEDWIRRTLMSTEPPGALAPSAEWTEERVRWEDESRAHQRRAIQPNPGWRWLGGSERATGHLIGGCLEVLDFLRGTPWWPGPEYWDGAVFYWETSEDVPPPSQVRYTLRVYGMLGVYDRLAGMLVGRPRGYTAEQRAELAESIERVVGVEFGRPDLPVVLDLDFGHTDPQMVLPNGGRVVIDPTAQSITLPDPATDG